MSGEASAFVLYVDHEGHPAPLSLCYHATASRRLASAVDRHPPSTVTEVDSAFCPQCLSFHDATSAASLGYCPKPSCRQCPVCQSIVRVTVDDRMCLYKCGFCEWTSQQCYLAVPIATDSNGAVTNEDLEKALGELETEWKSRLDQRNGPAQDHFRNMQKTLKDTAKEHVKGNRAAFFWLPTSNVRRKDGPEGWSVETLEESLQNRKKLVSAALAETVGGEELEFISLMVDKNMDESLEGKTIESLLLQGAASCEPKLEELLPQPVALRARKSRRCRAELAEGRPGILVKPKLNPLEGDSSLRTGHGQWWKKDSSAIQVLPRVRVSTHASDDTKHVFLLKVVNPTLGTIRLRFAASEYKGEPQWDDISANTPLLQDLTVDPFLDQTTNAKLLPKLSQNLDPTEVFVLEPAEDSFLELGKSSDDVPEQVAKWDASSALVDSKVNPEGPNATLKLISQRNSMAWLELVTLNESVDKGLDCALPISMQIEVGNGSWDSSFVVPEVASEKDLVPFDIVIVWSNSDS
eukprot:Nitzschia sp. Nitz4//scaffold3_size479765//365768//367408//NITZ4_000152-RA/size479765-processed-gene-1.255-mRNA-1//1//CDS//3329550914//6054//frame0